MPIDEGLGCDMMPSIYCEVGYSKHPGGIRKAINVATSQTKVNTRNPMWNEQLQLPFFVHHLVEEKCEDPANQLMYVNEQLAGYLHIAFYDENTHRVGAVNKPIAEVEFPLIYFEPFKPLNFQLKLPLNHRF